MEEDSGSVCEDDGWESRAWRVNVQSYRFPDIASNVPSVGAEVSQSV